MTRSDLEALAREVADDVCRGRQSYAKDVRILAALERVDREAREEFARFAAAQVEALRVLTETHVAATARAVAVERERAARIAEAHAPAPTGATDTRVIHGGGMARAIAAAIREDA